MGDFIDALCLHVEGEVAGATAIAEDCAYCCFLGSASCGKSTLIAALRSAPQPPTPTVGLEYSYLRCPALPQEVGGWVPPLRRELAHVWEVGGSAAEGSTLAEWLQIPVTPQRLPGVVLVVVLDCGRPLELCSTALRVFSGIRKRVEECCEKLAKAAARGGAGAPPPGASPEALLTLAQARLALGYAQRGGQSAAALEQQQEQPLEAFTAAGAARALAALPPHPDAARLLRPGAPHSTLLPCAAIVVGARWDAIRDAPHTLPPTAKRTLLALLRLLALAHGAALVCTSAASPSAPRDAPSVAALRTALHHAAFAHEGRRGAAVEVEGPAAAGRLPLVPPGADSLAAICAALAGCRGGEEAALGRCEVPLEARVEGLAGVVREAFAGFEQLPAASAAPAGGGGAQDLGARYPEPSIDAWCAAREAAAAAAREAREAERRMAEAEKRAATAAAAGGGGAASGKGSLEAQ
jgi:hypothetical protein